MTSVRPVAALRSWRTLPSSCQLLRLDARHEALRKALSITRTYSSRSLQSFPDPAALDIKWRSRWKDHRLWNIPNTPNGKYYVLPMFPYPSGALHIGHLRVYTISDVIARFRRMSGHDVLHPIGWDAFGLPAENAAIERGVDPAEWTLGNIQRMKEQIEMMGGCWSWDTELKTCGPEFYKDTQKLFLQLFEHGLAYQKEAEVNWDPVDLTVLANEQVDDKGHSWRSGAKVEKKMLRQWFLNISAFRESLLQDLDVLARDDSWPSRVLQMQRNWLGKSTGATVRFNVQSESQSSQQTVEVFTTRPDTLFGVQYLAIARDHPIAQDAARNDPAVQAFIDESASFDRDSKAGLRLPGVSATNPLAALHPEMSASLPIFVAPYVLSDYGSRAVMGVPAHDSRDFSFWKLNKRNDEEDPRFVINLKDTDVNTDQSEPFTFKGTLDPKCGPYAGLPSDKAGARIVQDLSKTNAAEASENWRLRDWLISRQRYWGTPIPVVHCASCNTVPVPADQLPVELPSLSGDRVKGQKGNLLEQAKDWIETTCPKCGGSAKRETDTMDTFVDSSWYYYRFAEGLGGASPFMPVDVYIGGVEHAILHLLYARFIAKFLGQSPNEIGVEDQSFEPFRKLLTQGMVHGKTFSDCDTGRFLKPDEVDLSDPQRPKVVSTGKVADVSFEKMSKSKYNGVEPTEYMRRYGADTTRAHLLFQAPVSEVLDWDEDKIVGIQRWFRRVWHLAASLQETHSADPRKPIPTYHVSLDSEKEASLWEATQLAITSVEHAYSTSYSLNTVVSDLMNLTNVIYEAHADPEFQQNDGSKQVLYQSCNILLRLMTPIAPSFAEECWACLHAYEEHRFDPAKTASLAGFPQADGSLKRLQARSQTCAFQVNGKLKFVAKIPTPPETLDETEVRDWVLKHALESTEGKEAISKGKWSMSGAKKIIIARRGKTVNVVL